MSLRILLTVDEGEAADLIALLAKALGRGELGILEVRLEPIDAAPKRLAAPTLRPSRRGRPPGIPRNRTGGFRWAKLKPMFERGPMQFGDITAALTAAGFAGTGSGNAVKQWRKFGFIEKIAPYCYAITEEGRRAPAPDEADVR